MENNRLRGKRGSAFVTIVERDGKWMAEVTCDRGGQTADGAGARRDIRLLDESGRADLLRSVVREVDEAVGPITDLGGLSQRGAAMHAR